MEEKDFNKMFDEYYDEATKQVKGIPDSTLAWDRLRKILDKRRRRQHWIKRLMIASVIILSMSIGAVLSNSPQIAKAISSIVQQIKKLEDGSVSFFFGSSPQSESEASITEGEVERIDITLEEINSLEGVPLPNLTFLTEDFKVNHVWLYHNKLSKKKDKMRIQIRNIESEHVINIHFSLLGLDENLISGGNEGTTEEKLSMGSIGYFSPAGEGRHAIEFLISSIHVLILGEISKDDIIRLSNRIIESK